MSLATPQSVRKLQRALYAKAKANPAYRFYALYDKVWRKDVLWHAWGCCRANGGAAGVDGESFEQIESRGVEVWLDGLMEELKTKTYRPGAVRRVFIPKPDGKQRVEADLPEEQYAYRPRLAKWSRSSEHGS